MFSKDNVLRDRFTYFGRMKLCRVVFGTLFLRRSRFAEIVDRIQEREKEIEELLQKVLEEERQKKEEEEKKKKEDEAKNRAEVEEDAIEAAEAAPSSNAPEAGDKRKRGNFFQRMMHALRRRFGGPRGTRSQG
jgi:predicted phage gp36 major capsid-like protein